MVNKHEDLPTQFQNPFASRKRHVNYHPRHLGSPLIGANSLCGNAVWAVGYTTHLVSSQLGVCLSENLSVVFHLHELFVA
jgi:hypothetical protein